jgi:hypothetical protein
LMGAGRHNAIDSATPESLERAGLRDDDPANRPGEGTPAGSDAPSDAARIDGAADTGPGTMPQGATPKVPRRSGDPLTDAHEPNQG